MRRIGPSGWLAGFVAFVFVATFVPDTFLAFMFGLVGGGFCALNLGESMRERKGRRAA